MNKPTFVYMIEAQNGVIKIGCSDTPKNRLAAVRTHSPIPARLISMWLGSHKDELAFHKQFKSTRNHCGWFICTGEFDAFVQERRGLGLDRIEEWAEILYSDEDKKMRSRRLRSVSMKAAWVRQKENPNKLGGLGIRYNKGRIEYFKIDGNTPAGLAAKIGVHPSTITRPLKGERQPSFDLARSVEKATDGAITAQDFMAACMEASSPSTQEPA